MNCLEHYGFTPFFQEQIPPGSPLAPGRVTAVHRERCEVMAAEGPAMARLSGGFLQRARLAAGAEGGQKPDTPTVGDFVLLRENPGGDWLVEQVLARKTKFSRIDYAGHAEGYVKTVQEQMVAANFDTVVVLSSLNWDFSPGRLQRYTVAAWESGARALVVLTKADLVDDPAPYIAQVEAAVPGAEVLAVSAHTGAEMEALAPYVQPGQTLVLLGMSGVGKSSLVNALAGREMMAVKAIREEDSRGRHTTTHRQMIALPDGALLIDTPGMRELGLWDSAQGLSEGFADVEGLFARCRFGDCGHGGEPGCAVRAALEAGELDEERWAAYLKLQRELRFHQSKAARGPRVPHVERYGGRRAKPRNPISE